MSERLAGRVAMITGGASGIGLGVARRYVAEGARVVLGDRNAASIEAVTGEFGDAAATLIMDVTDETAVEALAERAVQRFGRLDIAVNCAGLGTFAPITEMAESQWDTVIDICLKGVFFSTKHAATRMEAGGSIVNIASINAVQPAEGMSAYCAAKAGVVMLTRVAALELGPRGIRVNAIAPGLVDTPLTQFQRDRAPLREAFLREIPMGRVGTPEDIAGAALFLASDDASWVNGETLFVDGGEVHKKYPELFRLRG